MPGSEASGWSLPAMSTAEDGEGDSEGGCAKLWQESKLDFLCWCLPLLGSELYDKADTDCSVGEAAYREWWPRGL